LDPVLFEPPHLRWLIWEPADSGARCYRRAVTPTLASAPGAQRALILIEALQRDFAAALEAAARAAAAPVQFESVSWLRDGGRHGGGQRLSAGASEALDRASINVSQVHYDDDPARALSSATALSTIIHPRSPHAPSVHIHVSWTELRAGRGYWRLMADLNPALADPAATAAFAAALEAVAPDLAPVARAQGDRYFWIPALGRHRGATHFYLEDHATDDPAADLELARRLGEAATRTYVRILAEALAADRPVRAEDRAAQLAYHTLYLFQVLTLDRGTTSGLLIHDQNDLGILGSLPSRVDRALLASWGDRLPPPQGDLLAAIVSALPDTTPALVSDAVKAQLAHVVRAHYRAHPEALALQASGGVEVPTVANHR
jgi:coproporphyrinogen III oxidase